MSNDSERNPEIFVEIFKLAVEKLLLMPNKFSYGNNKDFGTIKILNSSTVTVSLKLFPWADYKLRNSLLTVIRIGQKKKGYQQSEAKAIKIYDLAKQGIPTLSPNASSTKMVVLEAVLVLQQIDKTLALILSQI